MINNLSLLKKFEIFQVVAKSEEPKEIENGNKLMDMHRMKTAFDSHVFDSRFHISIST